MGGFGQVTGQLANDWSQNQQTRQQTADSRTALAQQILSSQIQNQLAQQKAGQETSYQNQTVDLERQRLQAEQLASDRTYQLAKANHEIAGWETHASPYKDKDGNWHEDWYKPSTGEKKTYDYPAGATPSDIYKAEDEASIRAKAASEMEDKRQRDRLEIVKQQQLDRLAVKKLASTNVSSWPVELRMQWSLAMTQFNKATGDVDRAVAVLDRSRTLTGTLLGQSTIDDANKQLADAQSKKEQAMETMQALQQQFSQNPSSFLPGGKPATITIAPMPNATVLK